MDWDYSADSPDALRGIGPALRRGPTQKALDEQVQMVQLLQALAGFGELSYPVRVKHTHSLKPDFQLLLGDQRIAVEASKVTSQNYEHAASLQREGIGGVLMTAEFLRRGQKRMTKGDVIEAGFQIPQEVRPPSLNDALIGWSENAEASIDTKLKKLEDPSFQHGDMDWLLLWDRLGFDAAHIRPRLEGIHSKLLLRWQSRAGFARVFIQGEDFSWLACLSQTGVVLRQGLTGNW